MSISKKVLLPILISAILILPLYALAASKSGVIQGFDCVSHGVNCPTDNMDPHIALEKDFVLLTSNGYYLIPNIDAKVLAKYVSMKAMVEGEVNEKYNSITASSLTVNGKVVWSQAMVDEAYKKMFMR